MIVFSFVLLFSCNDFPRSGVCSAVMISQDYCCPPFWLTAAPHPSKTLTGHAKILFSTSRHYGTEILVEERMNRVVILLFKACNSGKKRFKSFYLSIFLHGRNILVT